MNDPPAGWPRIASAVFYEQPGEAIDWLVRVLGFDLRLKVEGDAGRVEHSELTFGTGVVMVTGAGRMATHGESNRQSPRALGGANTQQLCIFVDDVDAHCARARAAGARIVQEPTTTEYGEEHGAGRSYAAVDPEGHLWYFSQRLR
jgi:uncharacterized glyoxalase superfamily protein PhnB